tara:strand:- start:8931 stop:9650 length:720 start_codon:yes stop_codon:yes gene_type:complete
MDKLIKDIRTVMEGGGAAAGTLELVKTSYEKALEHAKSKGVKIEEMIPSFKKNFEMAKKLAAKGFAKRKDMPVIDNTDVKNFQKRLSNGLIDIRAPFAKNDLPDEPFPQGLDRNTGKTWVKSGLPRFDGNAKDDIVTVSAKKVAVKNLKPIQKQIYFDKSFKNIADYDLKDSLKFLKSDKNIFIISNDNAIIDGHHRFLTAMLIDPNISVNTIAIDLPIRELLPLTLSYTDAIGNQRNK